MWTIWKRIKETLLEDENNNTEDENVNNIEETKCTDKKYIEEITALLKETTYDLESVTTREDKNRALFRKHPDLIHPNLHSHEDTFTLAFGHIPSGVGVLDIGTGRSGVFMNGALFTNFKLPRICSDIDANINVPEGWEMRVMSGTDILKTFGENSFDHIQCCETMEHMDEDVSLDVATQMIKATRKTALITCCGLSHHLGPLNMTFVRENKYLDYKGQPNIEDLMSLDYKVRLIDNYQIIAWFDKT